jgi:hypothetical protein
MGTWPYNAQTVDVAPRTGGHFGGLPTTQPSGCKAGLSETGEISAFPWYPTGNLRCSV